jgi:hypothetical protein
VAEPSGADRRGEVRIDSANLVNYRELAGRPGAASEDALCAVLGTARTLDLSATGCRVLLREPLPVGARLTFDLQLGEHVVTSAGVVMRCTPHGAEHEAGIAFEGLDDLAKDGIRLYLSLEGESLA